MVFLFCMGCISMLYGQSDQTVSIDKITIHIDGSSREKYLLREVGLFEGITFNNRGEMEDFLHEAKQDLINQRVFEIVDYSLEPSSEKENSFCLYFHVKDSFTFYPIPYPKYNSNTGGRLGLKVFYYNAFGTLSDLMLFSNMDINIDDSGNWKIPNWHITPFVEGLSLFGQDFRAEYSHKYTTVTSLFKSDSFHNDSLSLGTKFFLPYDFFYSLDPRLGVNYAVEGYVIDQQSGNPIYYDASPENNPDLDVLEFTWEHTIGYDNLDWIGNFRNGFYGALQNSIKISSDLLPEIPLMISGDLEVDMKYFWRISRVFNFSTRGQALFSFNNEMLELGSHLRGVRDELLFGDKALFWNIDMNISVIDWDGVGEAQFRPFFNLGYVRNDINNQLTEDQRNMLAYGVGADFVLYIDKLSALQARATIGIDLSHYEWTDGEKYEIDITTELSY